MRLPGRKASAIYPARRLPAGSSATYPPTRTGRPSEARTKISFPAHFSIGVHGLATRSPYGCRHCCRHRWALTPPFHPCLAGFTKETRGFGGRSLLRMHELTPVWQFHQCGALRCPDFPPLPVHPRRCRKQRQSPLACCMVLFFCFRAACSGLADPTWLLSGLCNPKRRSAGWPGDTAYRGVPIYCRRFMAGRL